MRFWIDTLRFEVYFDLGLDGGERQRDSRDVLNTRSYMRYGKTVCSFACCIVSRADIVSWREFEKRGLISACSWSSAMCKAMRFEDMIMIVEMITLRKLHRD